MNTAHLVRRCARLLAAALVLALGAACASSGRGLVPPGTLEPDKFLYDAGNKALSQKKWIAAREYYKQIVDTYTQSPYRPDAKLGVGDAYLGEGTSEALVLAIAELREFLTFYPTNAKADLAQYKLALAHFRQMRAPERDQSETREAIKEFEIFIERYPGSPMLNQGQDHLRQAKERLSLADYQVGYFYYRQRWYPGAVDRFRTLLKQDPEFGGRDGLYFYLAESLLKVRRPAEALPYYERIIEEFKVSEYLPEAKKRIAELKAQPANKS